MSFKHYNQKFYFSVTGGGSLFLSQILQAGGASSFFVGANIPYDNQALENFVGGLRRKCCSESSARQLAISSEAYAKSIGIEAIGVGCSASLSRGADEREGRIHSIYVAAAFREHCVSLEWTHCKQRYSRVEEETIAADLIRKVSETFSKYIDDRSHLIDVTLESAFKNFEFNSWGDIKVNFPSNLAKFQISTLKGINALGYFNDVCFKNFQNTKGKTICIYPGSFDPIHSDHLSNFKKCEELYGPENSFIEISIFNFEKPVLDSLELSNRIENMRKATANILITNKAKFAEKSAEIKRKLSNDTKVIFAVGEDTFSRIEPIDGCSFLVFPRNGKRVTPLNFSGNKIEQESFTMPEGLNLKSRDIRWAN